MVRWYISLQCSNSSDSLIVASHFIVAVELDAFLVMLANSQ